MCPTGSNSISLDGQGRYRRRAPAEITVDGRYLYGAPAAKLELEGEVIVAPASERPGFARYQFGLADEEVETTPPAARKPA